MIERNVIKHVDKDECDKDELIEQGDKKVDRDERQGVRDKLTEMNVIIRELTKINATSSTKPFIYYWRNKPYLRWNAEHIHTCTITLDSRKTGRNRAKQGR